MIHLNSGIAKWEPHITTDNGEHIGSKMNGVEFRAYETELKYRSQSDLIPGTTSTYNSVSFALRTEETDKLRGITADDIRISTKRKLRTWIVNRLSSSRQKNGLRINRKS